eukprot:scaffold1786_cov163-Chaetoceros_neogracile.AAC.1
MSRAIFSKQTNLICRVKPTAITKTSRSYIYGACASNRSFSSNSSSSNSSSSNSSSDSKNFTELPLDVATIVQGPSLLTNTNFHRPSPSIFFLPGLRSLPFWTAPPPANDEQSDPAKVQIAYNDPTVTKVVQHLEANYETIKTEYLQAVMGMGNTTDMTSEQPQVAKPLQPDYDINKKGGEHASNKLHVGNWDWHSYVLNGTVQPKFQEACPKTAALLEEMEEHLFFGSQEENSRNPFGFAFFSTLHGKSLIKPHTGPMNLRLRIHLPLIVPSNIKPDAFSKNRVTKCGLRVGDQIRSWKEGKAVVLDDSYEHEVWNETKDLRVLLLVDIWHPDVRKEERARIGKMFGFAMTKGWIGNQDGKEE